MYSVSNALPACTETNTVSGGLQRLVGLRGSRVLSANLTTLRRAEEGASRFSDWELISRPNMLKLFMMLVVLTSVVEILTSSMSRQEILGTSNPSFSANAFPNQVDKYDQLVLNHQQRASLASNPDFSSSMFLSYHIPSSRSTCSFQHHIQPTASITDLSRNTPSHFERGFHVHHSAVRRLGVVLFKRQASDDICQWSTSRCLSSRSVHHPHHGIRLLMAKAGHTTLVTVVTYD